MNDVIAENKAELVVRADVLYDGTMGVPQRDVDVILRGQNVSAVRPASGRPDFVAACVVPGLVNAHAHLEQDSGPDPLARITQAADHDRLLTATANARRALAAGVTSMRDMGASNRIAIDVREAVNDGRIPGPRIAAAGSVLCMTGGHGWPIGRCIDGPVEARRAVREQRAAGADFVKLIATGGVLTKGAVPGRAELTVEEMTAACDEAHRHDLRVAAHAIGTQGIKDALRSGVDSIEHGFLIDDEGIDLLVGAKVFLVPTLSAVTRIVEHAKDEGQPSEVVGKAEEVTEGMTANLRRAVSAGARLAGGSDAGTPFNRHEDYANEVRLMVSLLGLSAQQALHAATAVASELSGFGGGTLRSGDAADLLLLDDDIDQNPSALAKPKAVFKGGGLITHA